jgi:signal transduction histidine kinase
MPIGTSKLLQLYTETHRGKVLASAALLLAAIILVDWIIVPGIPLGGFYILPILLAAGFLNRYQLVGLSLVCAILREAFGTTPLGMDSFSRIALRLTAFIGAGLFVSELARNRQVAISHLLQIQKETQLRKDLEKELQVLINCSPVAILILDEHRKILLANPTACFIFGIDHSSEGKQVDRFLPILKDILEMGSSSEFRSTETEAMGCRQDGQIFQAHLWLSAYPIGSGKRYAVIAADVSDELRDREKAGVDRLLSNSRILVGALAHEIRNVCGAISVAHANLLRMPGIAENHDFKALGSWLETLRRLASAELRPLDQSCIAAIPLRPVLNDLRIVIEPAFQELGATISWHLPLSLPYVLADPQSLLQVFLNLTQNSYRAMQETSIKVLSVSCEINSDTLFVKITDTGTGVQHPDFLFRPFQEGAEDSGLGLYISKAIARSFGGDLRFEPSKDGACFIVELSRADTKEPEFT